MPIAQDLTVTSSSDIAADACVTAVTRYAERRSDTMPALKTAIEVDPDCCFAHAFTGLLLCSLRKDSVMPAAQDAYLASQRQYDSATRREQLYVEALQVALDRKPNALADCYETIVNEFPSDLAALAMFQGECFWFGDMQRSEYVSASTVKAWQPEQPGYSEWLSIRAFDLEEVGRLTEAEAAGREAVAINPTNTWGAHAVAHVLEMRGDNEKGVEWLDGLKDNWTDANQLKFHLWWHRCLFHVERGEHDVVLSIYDDWIRNEEHPLMQALPDFYLDVQNAASLLIRLEILNADIGDRWHALAAAIEPTYLTLSSPFTTLHTAMVLAATNQFDRLDKLIQSIEDFSKEPGALQAAFGISLPAIRAIKAHRLGEHRSVIELMMPCRKQLWELGGSHAQRDVLFQIMFDSARKLKREDLLSTLHHDLEKIGFVGPTDRIAYRV